MGNKIDELASYVQPLCEQFLALALAKGIPCLLVCTGRTLEQSQENVAKGVSWTKPEKSRHLPQPPEGKSEAFDVVPKVYVNMPNWNPGGPLWKDLGEIGESLGLKWGGRWTHLNAGYGDPGHLQWVEPSSLQQA